MWCEEEEAGAEQNSVCLSVACKCSGAEEGERVRERERSLRRNNSSSQKYAAVQPGPLSTGSMTGAGWVIPLIEECAASKLLSVCLCVCPSQSTMRQKRSTGENNRVCFYCFVCLFVCLVGHHNANLAAAHSKSFLARRIHAQ